MHLIFKLLVLALVAQQKVFCSRVCEELNDWGFACDTCSKLVQCVNIDGSWRSILVDRCNTTAGEYCNSQTKSCGITDRSCNITAPASFLCTGEGVFPDPYNCRRYHFCFKPDNSSGREIAFEDVRITCPPRSSFQPSINDCVDQLTCSSPVVNCTRVGFMDRWPGSTRIFYICADREPDASPEDEEDGEAVAFRFARMLENSQNYNFPLKVFPILFRCSPDKVYSTQTNRCETESS